jgi:hypothetical protein
MRPKIDLLLSASSVLVAAIALLAGSSVILESNGTSYRLAILAFAVILAFVAGVYSTDIARFLRRLPRRRRVFLSYAREDADMASTVAAHLRRAGARVWVASEQIKPGQDIRQLVEAAIAEATYVVVLLSNRTSAGVTNDLSIANAHNKPIIAVLLEPSPIPIPLQGQALIDLSSDFERGLQALVEAST